MKDHTFTIYNEGSVFLGGEIRDGALRIDSEVYGEDFDSEKHYVFSVEDTNKLFSVISLEDFIRSCRKGHLMWMEAFLEEHGIKPSTVSF